jgi:hypothetical protein
MVMVLSQFHDYDTSSAQFRWFNSTAARLDRTTYPWLIVAYHMPLYTTLYGHYHETECFRWVKPVLSLSRQAGGWQGGSARDSDDQ